MNVALASSNPGKLRELSALLNPLGLMLVSQQDLGVSSAAETGLTFIENALEKARHVSAACGLPAIADDSGLVVAALNGAPGIHSARYAGAGASDAENNAKLITALAAVAEPAAHYYCALVYLDYPEDPAPLVATGEWHGIIRTTPRGTNGFGYDPHFFLPELGRTAAELDAAAKNRISHRGLAAASLLAQLPARLHAAARRTAGGAGLDR